MVKIIDRNFACKPDFQPSCCNKKILSYDELQGELTGKALKEIVDGKNNFAMMKKIFDEAIKLLSDGSPTDIANFMIRISNEIKFKCSICKKHSSVFTKQALILAKK